MLSGLSVSVAGLYLGLWAVFFCAPENVASGLVWEFARKDLVQQQHLAISALSIVGGLLEILWSVCGSRAEGNRVTFKAHVWHVIWCCNASMAGIMFLTHPQHHEARRVTVHIFLGLSMAWAAFFMTISKIKNFPPSLEQDYTVIMAGLCQIVACLLLISYSEHRDTVHYGILRSCHGAWGVTILGFLVASLSIWLIALHVVWSLYPAAFLRVNGAIDNIITVAFATASIFYRMCCTPPGQPAQHIRNRHAGPESDPPHLQGEYEPCNVEMSSRSSMAEFEENNIADEDDVPDIDLELDQDQLEHKGMLSSHDHR
ncbi:hypothetical protein AAMO2058_000674700 [Amorphochlora amoebiformis]